MWLYAVKTLISALVIVAVTETAKRSGLVGGLIKSLPLISLVSFIWLYLETRDVGKVAALSVSTFYFVIPTLPAFLLFPALLRLGWGFWPSFGMAILSMLLCYGLMLLLLNRLNIQL